MLGLNLLLLGASLVVHHACRRGVDALQLLLGVLAMDFLSVFRPLRTAARLTGRSIRFGLVRPSSIFPWLWSTMPDSQTPRRPSARPPGRCARRPPRCPCRRACPSRRYRRPRLCSRPRRPLSTDRSSRLVHRVVGGPLVGLGVPMLPADALSCQDDLLCSRLFLKPPPRSGEPPSPWPWRHWFRSPTCPLCLLAKVPRPYGPLIRQGPWCRPSAGSSSRTQLDFLAAQHLTWCRLPHVREAPRTHDGHSECSAPSGTTSPLSAATSRCPRSPTRCLRPPP
mmetsp:Transcript_132677/g.424632  ORF Transcript_132677/g.424632 Transcript_132677/m.424632 type:complete len:281 (+) Transcript_132677:527-1369(+)